jgi:hypothetical protein
MKKITAKTMQKIVESLNWTGHCEFPQSDINWLSEQLASALNGDGKKCDNCGNYEPVLVSLALGNICETCLEDATEDAEDQREGQE